MTVKTLIEKLSHYNKNAIVRLHHREGEELLFALAFQNDDTTVVLETESLLYIMKKMDGAIIVIWSINLMTAHLIC